MLFGNMANDAFLFPVLIMREGDWYVASCSSLSIATQGRSENEVKENMVDLIHDYLSDKDTLKPKR